MARITSLLIAVLLIAPTLVGQIQLPVQVDTLANGLTLITCPDATAPTISVQTFVNAGSRDEDRPGITGLAHVFEHMMFRGTSRYPDYNAAVARFGAQNNAYTTEDYTCYYVHAPAEFLDGVLDIEADRIRNLNFTKETFRTELGPVKEERRRGEEDNAGGWLGVEMLDLAYTKHTYKHPVIGSKEDLETNMTFEDGLQFKNHFYVPNNCILSVAGNFDRDSLRTLVDYYYGDWARGEPYTPHIEAEPPQEHERVKNYVWKDSQTSPLLDLAYHTGAPGKDLQRSAVLQMIARILTSRSGRLTRKLKDDLAWVQSVRADAQFSKDPGLFTIDARLSDGIDLQAVTDTILALLTKLSQDTVSTEEVDRARNSLRADMIYRLERPAGIAGSLGYYDLLTGDWQGLYQMYDVYGQVSPEQIMQIATEVFSENNRTLVTLMPKPKGQGTP